MKTAHGVCWKYKNSDLRGMTYAAELRIGNALFCSFGQKTQKAAISAANKAALSLGWKMKTAWSLIENKKNHQCYEQKASD